MVALVSAVVLVFGVMPAHAATPVDQVSGTDRYRTAAEVVERSHPAEAETVYIASGTSFPDALAGGPAAAAAGAPLLLARTGGLPGPTRSQIERLDPSQIVVLGGVGALGQEVLDALRIAAPEALIMRLSGEDRYATAAAISEEVFEPGPEVVYIASGEDYPDALSGGAAAGVRGAPILLVKHSTIPADVKAELERLGPQRIAIVGGESAIGAKAAASLGGYGEVERIAGIDRYDTAAAISRDSYPAGADTVYLATGVDFPDALAAGPAAAADRAPLLLVQPDRLPGAAREELKRLKPARVVVLGGKNAISKTVVNAAADPDAKPTKPTKPPKPEPPIKAVVKYRVITDGQITTDIDTFRDQVQETLDDPRGWRSAGVKFERVVSGGSMVVVLANANRVTSYAPSVCSKNWSCRVGNYVIINQDRWKYASLAWNAASGAKRDYRHMVVNHEVGHWLGSGHRSCPGRGKKAPVMQQQSISLGGCTFNPWPLSSEKPTNRFG